MSLYKSYPTEEEALDAAQKYVAENGSIEFDGMNCNDHKDEEDGECYGWDFPPSWEGKAGDEDEEDGLRFDELVKENEALKFLLSSSKPVCPFCQSEMRPVNYTGYYDKFSFWECNCKELKGGEIASGMYA